MDIKKNLESFGYEVPYVATSGEEAIEKAHEIMPDLVLMDIVLKGQIDGIEAASKIKALNIPIIYLTAYADGSLIQRAKQTNPYGYLLKPYDIFGLNLTIEIALNNHENGQELEEIINGSPVPLFFINKEHKVVYWNRAMEKYSGIMAEEVVGTDQHWKAFYSEKRPCMVDLLADNKLDQLQKLYSGINKSELIDGAYKTKDFFPKLGVSGKWLNYSATAIKNPKGIIIGALEMLEV